MKYKEVSERIYSSIKNQQSWNKKDLEKITAIEIILREEVAKDRRLERYQNKKSNKLENIPNLSEKPLSLLERLSIEQDMESFNIKPDPSPRVIDIETIIPKQENGIKRFLVQFECFNFKQKPPFQVFKLDDILEKDFQTDTIIKQRSVYQTFIDCEKTSEIYEKLPTYFNECYITKVDGDSFGLNLIPYQYADIWQNRTQL